MRMSSARLAMLYAALVTVLTSILLLSVYLVTRNALEREIAAVVRAELADLSDDLRLGGLPQVAATLRLRADSWGRTGAVFLMADSSFRPVAGNLSAWPRELSDSGNGMVEFEIAAHERGDKVLHPVEARIERLPNGYWLLVGADTSERQRVLRSFGLATLWGIALTALCVWLVGAAYARRTARRVRDYATTCDTIIKGDLTQRLSVEGSHDEFDALASAVNIMLDRIEQQTTTLRTAFDSIAHDLRTLSIVCACGSKKRNCATTCPPKRRSSSRRPSKSWIACSARSRHCWRSRGRKPLAWPRMATRSISRRWRPTWSSSINPACAPPASRCQ